MRCQCCNGTRVLWTSDDGTIVMCLECIRVVTKHADTPTLAESWWKWMQDGAHRGRTSA